MSPCSNISAVTLNNFPSRERQVKLIYWVHLIRALFPLTITPFPSHLFYPGHAVNCRHAQTTSTVPKSIGAEVENQARLVSGFPSGLEHCNDDQPSMNHHLTSPPPPREWDGVLKTLCQWCIQARRLPETGFPHFNRTGAPQSEKRTPLNRSEALQDFWRCSNGVQTWFALINQLRLDLFVFPLTSSTETRKKIDSGEFQPVC